MDNYIFIWGDWLSCDPLRGSHDYSYYIRGDKWNESGFRPPLCTYRLNWARRTSWGWWDDWDDTVLQTQDSKFEPWRSEAEHATSRSRRLPTILTFTRGWGRNNFVSFKPPRPGTEPRTLAWKAAVLTTTLGPPPHIRGDRSHDYSYYIRGDRSPLMHREGLKVIYHPLHSMNNFVTNKSKLPQDGAQVFPYMGWLAIMWPSERVTW